MELIENNLPQIFALCQSKIDLVDEASLRNPCFKEELEETKHLIYG